MTWYAKPNGGYSIGSTEGTANVKEITDYLRDSGYHDAAIAGIVGNIMAEGALNPWYWEGGQVRYGYGYGLVQYTPASEYINASWIPNHSPNLSVSEQTAGATPEDGKAQLYAFVHDSFGKWVNTCWRSYWDPDTYSSLYEMRSHILSTYGNGSRISMSQFKTISNYEDATFAYLACFEGPAVPNYTTRKNYAAQAKQIIDNYKTINILIWKKIIDNQHSLW